MGDTDARQKAREWISSSPDKIHGKMLEIGGWAVHNGVMNEFDVLLHKVFEENSVDALTSNAKALNMVNSCLLVLLRMKC